MGKQITVESIEYNSPQYQQACQLRYELFFAEHNLPWEVVRDLKEADYFHAAIVTDELVVAYGQLVPRENRIYQICQMVVRPNYQRQNLGRKILLALIDLARQQNAIALELNARLTAVGFYQKLGFEAFGLPFPSSTTEVPHIAMKKLL